MNYQSSGARQVQTKYIERYVSEEEVLDSDYEFGSDSSDTYSEYEASPSATQYRRLAEGESAPTSDSLEELDEIESEVAGMEEGGLDTTQANKDLNTLLSEVTSSHLPASKKEDLIAKIKELLKKLQVGQLEDPFLIEELQLEYQGILEENPPFGKRVSSQLNEQGYDITQAKIQEALKSAKLTEEKLSKIQLPADAKTSKKLVTFLLALDPTLEDLLKKDPYGVRTIKRVSEMLSAVLPGKEALSEDQVVSVLDQTISIAWNEAEIASHINGDLHLRFLHSMTGEVKRTHTSTPLSNDLLDKTAVGSIFGPIGGFVALASADMSSAGPAFGYGAVGAIFGGPIGAIAGGLFGWGQQDQISNLHEYIRSGWNDIDRGHHTHNDEARRILSGLFLTAKRNPYHFRRLVQMIPQQIRMDLKDVLLSHSGEMSEKQPGDVFDSQTFVDILDWVEGGDMPVDLQQEVSPEMPASSAPPTAA